MKPLEREQRMWWALGETYVQHVKGFSCAPANPGMWWCPAMGYSAHEGTSLFDTEREAKNALASEIRKKIANLEKALRDLGFQP